ncbi:MAG: hypothetical protein IH859_01215 [Chloroflexi bacterium]|nr:hypothetical protein [Chloroflexota bacterium]
MPHILRNNFHSGIHRIALSDLVGLFLYACGVNEPTALQEADNTTGASNPATSLPTIVSPASSTLTNMTGWQTLARMQHARSEMPAVVLDGKIYVPGGFQQIDGAASAAVVLEVYDPQSNAWDTLADMPAARHHLMAAGYNFTLYVFGGIDFNGAVTNTTWRYDPADDAWSQIANLPVPSAAGAAVSLGDYIYLVGGNPIGNTNLRYHPSTDTWTQMAPMQQPREHTAAVTLGGKIYALAGRWNRTELASVEVYDPQTDSWTEVTSMQVPRAGLAATVLNGEILVIGGEVFDPLLTLDSIESYDAASNTWSEFPSLSAPLHGVPAVTLGGYIYVLGGSSQAAGIDNHGLVYVYLP